MASTMTDVSFAATFLSHIVPVAITALVLLAIWAFRTYGPQLHYIALVSQATNDTGVIALAKYMAKKNGGKHIDTDHCWEAFVPAARAVSAQYRQKK